VDNLIGQDIIKITNNIINEYHQLMEQFQCNKGVKLIINDFLYNHFCDYFIEIHKCLRSNIPELDKVLSWCFFQLLLIIHCYCPFITEEIFKFYDNSHLLEYIIIIKPIIKCENFYSTMKIVKVIRFFQQVFISKNITIQNKSIPSIYENLAMKLTKTEISLQNPSVIYYDGYYKWGLDNINKNPEILLREIKKLENKTNQLKTILANEEFVKKADVEIVNKYKIQLEEYTLLMNCLSYN
jgi:valyl-tRNA synthetase